MQIVKQKKKKDKLISLIVLLIILEPLFIVGAYFSSGEFHFYLHDKYYYLYNEFFYTSLMVLATINFFIIPVLIIIALIKKHFRKRKIAIEEKAWNKFSQSSPIGTSKLKSELKETTGWAVVEGKGNLFFWLYDITNSLANGKITEKNMEATFFLSRYLPKWIEENKYIIDYSHVSLIKPNPELAPSIKSMMTLRGFTMAVYAYQSSEGKFVELDVYDVNENIWWSGIIPIIGQNGESFVSPIKDSKPTLHR